MYWCEVRGNGGSGEVIGCQVQRPYTTITCKTSGSWKFGRRRTNCRSTSKRRSRKPKKLDQSTRSQISRAANSIAANIVEGCAKVSRAELARFSDISIGSSSELEYWLLLTKDLGQLPEPDHSRLTASTIEVRKMLFGLRRAIKNGKQRPKTEA